MFVDHDPTGRATMLGLDEVLRCGFDSNMFDMAASQTAATNEAIARSSGLSLLLPGSGARRWPNSAASGRPCWHCQL